MTRDERRELLHAPELIVVHLLEHGIAALGHVLLAQHPLLDDDLEPEDPPLQRRARALLRHADTLRRALGAYRREVRAAQRARHNFDDLPF
jgi:hypothetical protein